MVGDGTMLHPKTLTRYVLQMLTVWCRNDNCFGLAFVQQEIVVCHPLSCFFNASFDATDYIDSISISHSSQVNE